MARWAAVKLRWNLARRGRHPPAEHLKFVQRKRKELMVTVVGCSLAAAAFVTALAAARRTTRVLT